MVSNNTQSIDGRHLKSALLLAPLVAAFLGGLVVLIAQIGLGFAP